MAQGGFFPTVPAIGLRGGYRILQSRNAFRASRLLSSPMSGPGEIWPLAHPATGREARTERRRLAGVAVCAAKPGGGWGETLSKETEQLDVVGRRF